ncbi:MAG: hypothetical protein KJ607_06190 [Bacteroidetes bacterium]|nr:hypothetical protein [Bacteroidota bacterium]
MKRLIIILLTLLFSYLRGTTQEAADLETLRQSIWYEGITLYDLEQAAWTATGILLLSFNNDNLGGHLAYKEGVNFHTIFWKYVNQKEKIQLTFDFEYPIDDATCTVTDSIRNPTDHERRLLDIRDSTLSRIDRDTGFFNFFPNIHFNIGILELSECYRIYAFSRTLATGHIPLGNDYLLVFSNNGEFISREKLHSGIVAIPQAGERRGDDFYGTMHYHEKSEPPYITPTDISTLLHYAERIDWEVHIVESAGYICTFNIRTRQLEIEKK